MRNRAFTILALSITVLAAAACAPGSVPITAGATSAPAVQTATLAAAAPAATANPAPTATLEPAPTAVPEPTATPAPLVLPLEVLEWSEFPYAYPADPQNTDTHVEVLVRNPNDFPVRVNLEEVELRLINSAGETVYANPNPEFYVWDSQWILGGESVPLSACVCFMTAGLPKREWETVDLIARLEAAPDLDYTTDVKVTVGEFFNLADFHLGGDMMAAEVSIENTSGQTLRSWEIRTTGRDADGRFVGVAFYGSMVDRDNSGNYAVLEPGIQGGGVIPTMIDYYDGPLTYETAVVGFPAQ